MQQAFPVLNGALMNLIIRFQQVEPRCGDRRDGEVREDSPDRPR